MQSNPEELNQFLAKMRRDFTHIGYIGNPFFYLTKPTEENMQKYLVSSPGSRVCLYFELFLVFPRILRNFMSSLAIATLKSSESRSWHVPEGVNARNLIISHYTHAQDPNESDIFFGKTTQDPQNFVFYLNSTRIDARVIQNIFYKANKRNLIVSTKSLSVIETIRLQNKQLHLSLLLLIKVLRGSQLGLKEKRLLITAAHFQHSRSTIANLVLESRLRDLLEVLRPKNLILTIEGHAHEALILELRNREFSQARLVGYQHAPIVPGQYSFYQVLERFNRKDLLLTCGKSTQAIINQALPDLHVKILGSPKFSQISISEKKFEKIFVLGAVEGSAESCNSFIRLFNILSKYSPQVAFTLRPHPAINKKLSKKLFRSLEISMNLQLSTKSLLDDLKEAHIVIFQSSAVGIQGLGHSVIPVHFDFSNLGLLNPLSGSAFADLEFADPSILGNFLNNFNIKEFSSLKFYEHCSVTLQDYYTPLKDLTSLID
jgi:hypothetical protein